MSKSEEDEIYEMLVDMVGDPPFHWHGGVEVAPEDYSLYRLSVFFVARSREGKVEHLAVGSADSSQPEKVVEAKLAEGGWTEVLKPLPNPSEIAWAYSPERGDYAGGVYMPGEAKKLMKKGRAPVVIRCPLPAEMHKVMLDLAPH